MVTDEWYVQATEETTSFPNLLSPVITEFPSTCAFLVAFIVTTAIARGGSWCTRNERSALTTFATGHDGYCINSWAAELVEVGWVIHGDIFGKNWGSLVLRNNGLELLIAHGDYLVKCFGFLFR
ncbi:uncharacterized protein Bfra_008500 [Botrytis fragariae]|uniref:Uncharacterized protein n=1 Tax=Botrytis fragariae TaxID=1964551 RepID=A0A8H6ASZ2_9HELO|nr:uncharacterized protein Bfra_008500 [Botrytis fragariae]KAF5873221.1 hypothetical protein Bfra_008500 [Botrytis fragariae]